MFQKTTLPTLIFSFFAFGLSAQDLILNPSFEQYTTCPKQGVNISNFVEDVSQPTSSSADYFHKCGTGNYAIPNNFMGNQEPAEGSAYAGLYYYALNDYREYLQLQTAQTLEEGIPYKIKFKVNLADNATISSSKLTIMLLNNKARIPNSVVLSPSRLDLVEGMQFQEVALTADNTLANKDGWVTVTGEFTSKGYENYLVFGNFKPNKDSDILTKKEIENSDFSYYFVDDFSLEALPRVNFEKDKIYVLERNPFEPKGFEMDEEAIASVKKIFKYLKDNAEVQMKITGHSDNSGTPEYNQFVSSLRARAVALYLKKMGIDESRIVWEGMGSKKPLRNGKIKENKLDDRRVEFVMTTFED